MASPHQQVHISAIRWTAKGNLVVIGSSNVTLHQLQMAATVIAQAFVSSYSATVTPSPPPTWANVKWSKLLINGLPTGMSNSWEVFTPEECHQTLIANNSSYAILPIMQKPSWVRSPSSYKADSSSSLIVAFEDPDGERLKSLLAARYLFAFGTRATAKKWKQRTHPKQTTSNVDPEHEESDDEVEILTCVLTPTPLAQHEVAPPQTPEEITKYLHVEEPSAQHTCATMSQQQPRQTRARK